MKDCLKLLCIVSFALISSATVGAQNFSSAANAAKPSSAAEQSKSCIAAKPAGSHAFRNIIFLGVAGAIVSKEQYKVMAVRDYPTHVGAKFHGNDLRTIQNSGTRVVILDKHAKSRDAAKACN
jgi:hypothetical protein